MVKIDKKHKKIHTFYKKLDRKLFVNDGIKDMADYDTALPIGYGQTISQPTLVVYMTYLLDLDKEDKVLEIGTGSGYQTAFLAEFSNMVYTIELISELSQKAQKRLKKLGYTNIKYKIDDGSMGWEEYAPYDKIIVTAAAGEIPYPMIVQLKKGGIMVVPTGPKGMQELTVIKKDKEGNITKESYGKVFFVELKGKYGWN